MDLDNFEDWLDLKSYAEKMYLGYSVSVLKDRAIPYLSDGQKPVQRRILFAMKEMNISAKAPPKKSARVVGDVIGKYHPHGDSSVYEAMVRMSQVWNLRYPLVDGQGNFGSMDGDGAAAMRYTEARLTPFSEHVLLSELNLGTVNFIGNYDNTLTEPDKLPSRLNTLLLNGAMGIAVGMACDIPSHNIRSVTDATIATIKNPKISHEELMDIIKGPDLPNGGQIIDDQETINEIYEKGQGVLKVRAKWKVEKLARNQWQVVVYEMPPHTSARSVLEHIDRITNPPQQKDKNGKSKTLSAKVLQEKNFMNSILNKAVDESDRKNAVRLVLEPKSSKQNPEEFMNALLSRVGLEQSMKVNMTTVGLDGLPKLKGIKDIVSEWVGFRFDTMTKRTQFQLDKVQKRIHILEGRLLALEHIDKVIKIIRESEDPKIELMNKIGVTEVQAEDILEIRLRQLAKMEHVKVQKELSSLQKEEKRLLGLLSSRTKMFNLMVKEIEEDTAMFEDERRTLLKPEKPVVAKSSEAIVNEPITVILTKKGWITQRKGHGIETASIQLKNDDSIQKVLEGKSIDLISLIANNGRAYSIKSTDIPSGKGGFAHLNSLINIEGNVSIVDSCFADGLKFLIFNNHGYGFISNTSSLETKNKAGKHFMTLPKKESVIFPIHFIDWEEDQIINILTNDDRLLSFYTEELKEFKELDKGKGYQLIKLPKGIEISDYSFSKDEIKIQEKSKKKTIKGDELNDYLSKRALRGKKVKEGTKLVKD
jgi:topoisomerase-4 subunit A